MNQNDLRRLAAIGGMDLTQPSVSFKDFNMFKNKGFDLLQDYQNTNKFIADNNLMQPPVDEEADKKAKRKEGLQNLRDTLAIIGARRSGKYALAEQMKQQVDLRKQQEEQQKKQIQLAKDREEFIKNNPELAGAIRMKELFDMDLPSPKKRDSYVAKDGYRYYVDDNTRVFPGVTVTETQSQEDIYKENAARIKNIILKEGRDSKNLTNDELNFYDEYIKRTGGNPFNQMIANMFENNNPGTQRNKIYKVINNAYGNTSAESIIKQAMELNGVSREEAIRNLKANNIIAE